MLVMSAIVLLKQYNIISTKVDFVNFSNKYINLSRVNIVNVFIILKKYVNINTIKLKYTIIVLFF